MELMNYLRSTDSFIHKKKEKLSLFIHNDEHTINAAEISPVTSLNKYLRDIAKLTGTKKMCLEGGCGICIVSITFPDPVTKKRTTISVNSCLVPVFICSGWNIHVIDNLGDSKSGYHPIQKAMIQYNGTQCGFCSPGMIMQMYSLYESTDFTMRDVENNFGGNICRCTGYRSILSGFKSLATDASAEMLGTSCDIEDIPICQKYLKPKDDSNFEIVELEESHFYEFGDVKWYKVFSINEILDIIRRYEGQRYMLVSGNTASGVYKEKLLYDVYIDINSVVALKTHKIENSELVLGANMTLTKTMDLFESLATKSKFSYLKKVAEHIDLIANKPVRNIGTLAGNLFVKYYHHEFPSDIFLLLETIGAKLTIIDVNRKQTTLSLTEFRNYDMKSKIIEKITIPSYDRTYEFKSYKIMPRAQNSHTMLSAGFLLKLENKMLVTKARLVYIGINPDFARASQAERYLENKHLFDNNTLKMVFKMLNEEIRPDDTPPDPSPKFRKKMALSLFYKFVLSIAPEDKISPRNKSGGITLTRPLSSGIQEYGTNQEMYPVTEPIPKIEALAQCTGKAEYVMDMPEYPRQLYGVFVVAKAPAFSNILQIDATKALKLKGVKAFFDKSDIPGENNFSPNSGGLVYQFKEELFCTGEVKYYYQPIGIVVATSQELAEEASELVEVSYTYSSKKPLLTIQDVLNSNANEKIRKIKQVTATTKGQDIKRVFSGDFNIFQQYHYYLENQCCMAVPVEDGLDLYPATQDMVLCNAAVAKVLNIPTNKINVNVRRLGGGFGGKLVKSSLVACATALAAYKLQQPIKVFMPLVQNMSVMGKRHPFYGTYEVGVNNQGIIQFLNASLYCDLGYAGGNEDASMLIINNFLSTYNYETWNLDFYLVYTDIGTNAVCRGPGTTEAIAFQESIIERIVMTLNLDPVQVRTLNLGLNTTKLENFITDLSVSAEINQRSNIVKKFNYENRWIKKGLAITPMVFSFPNLGNWNALVSIYQSDGTVSVIHGGIDMGQGTNTKAAQVCAYALGVSLNFVSVKPSYSAVSPNVAFSATSRTAEGVCYAVIKACEILKQRMQPIRENLKNPTWRELVRECFLQNIDMTASYQFYHSAPDTPDYLIYGVTCAEVELDVLTGQSVTRRVDILEEVGNSMSPLIDIGQVEGAFVMGMGYWLTENVVYDNEGKLLTNRTWNYKPPGAKDIPIDFRIQFPKNNPNPVGVLHSKAISEPPLCMSFSVALAVKEAVASARLEADSYADKWYDVDGPLTVENTFLNSLPDFKQYTL